MIRVLFVCTGDTCRSPVAEAVLRHRAAARGLAVVADSAGLGVAGCGGPPAPHAVAALRRRGYPPPERRARGVRPEDFGTFDRVLAMTDGHRRALVRLAPRHRRHHIELLLRYAPACVVEDVPDPFGGGPEVYEAVLELVEQRGGGPDRGTGGRRGLTPNRRPAPARGRERGRPPATQPRRGSPASSARARKRPIERR